MTLQLRQLLDDVVAYGFAFDYDGKQPRLRGGSTPDIVERCRRNRNELVAWLGNPQPVTPSAAHLALVLRAQRLFPASTIIR